MAAFEFHHQRLVVYKEALKLQAYVRDLDPACFAGRSDRKSQLYRACDSVTNNIGEGANKPSAKDRKRFFGYALGSAGECHANLEVLRVWGFRVDEGLHLIARIGAMLNGLV